MAGVSYLNTFIAYLKNYVCKVYWNTCEIGVSFYLVSFILKTN